MTSRVRVLSTRLPLRCTLLGHRASVASVISGLRKYRSRVPDIGEASSTLKVRLAAARTRHGADQGVHRRDNTGRRPRIPCTARTARVVLEVNAIAPTLFESRTQGNWPQSCTPLRTRLRFYCSTRTSAPRKVSSLINPPKPHETTPSGSGRSPKGSPS